MKPLPWLLLALAALGGAGIYKALHPEPTANPLPAQKASPAVSPSPVPLGGPFTLVDQGGAVRTEKSFPGKYLIVYFGYSYCPDICPMALFSLSQVMETLDPEGKRLQPLFITVDPARDTVETLALYAQNFHPTFKMLTGSPEKIAAAMRAFRVYAAAAPKEGSTEELIDHSSVIYVMSPEGTFLTHFNHATPVEEMLKGLRGVIKTTS